MAHKIKITLNNSDPAIWRTVIIPEKFTFAALHELIQIVMRWNESHLYEFSFGNNQNRKNIAPPANEDDEWSEDPDYDMFETEINDILPFIKNKLTYTYDFGDNWEHSLTFMAKPKEEVLYPSCLKGEGPMPFEDCGGVWGLTDMLQILKSTKKEDEEQIEEYREWLCLEEGDTYEDLYGFDIEEVNDNIIGFFC